MKNLIFISLLLFYTGIVNSQERFIVKSAKLMADGDFNDALDIISKFQEKEPSQPIVCYLKARWYSNQLNPSYNPDIAFSLLDTAKLLYNSAKGTKIEGEKMFEVFDQLYRSSFNEFQDSLALLSFNYFQNINTIEGYDYYVKKYSFYSFAKIAKKKAEHLRFLNVQKSDQLNRYLDFVKSFPDADDVKNANHRIYELEFSNYLLGRNTSNIKIYIRNYPNSHLIDSAWTEIYKIEFEKVIGSSNIDALESYIKEYPKSSYLPKVKSVLYLEAFNQAKMSNKISALRFYRSRYPESPYIDDCYNLELEIGMDEIKDNPSLDNIREYIANYPGSKYIDQLKQAETSLAFAEIESSESEQDFIKFMNDFPTSKEVVNATEKLIDLYIRNAELLLSEESYAGASDILNKVFEYDESNSTARFLNGQALAGQNLHSDAIVNFSKAIVKLPQAAVYYAERGFSYLNQGDYSYATADFKKCLSLESYNAKANYGLGYICDMKGEYDNAIYYYKQSQSMGYNLQDRISYLEDIERTRKAQQNSNQYRVNSNNNKVEPQKNLLLPRETLNRLKSRTKK